VYGTFDRPRAAVEIHDQALASVKC